MGDVVMMVQTVRNLLEHHPEITITVVTRPFFHVFFGEHERLFFFPLDLKDRHKGFGGLLRLGKDVADLYPDYFIDLHDVLRSKIVRNYLKTKGIKTLKFNKGRNEKKALINGKLNFSPLQHTIQRYAHPFQKIGLSYNLDYRFILDVPAFEKPKSDLLRIGFAPFSAHDSKYWGEENVRSFLTLIQQRGGMEVYLFGGGEKERTQLEILANDFSNAYNLSGLPSINEELSAMASCDYFLAMDSSNMHMADLVGCIVISIWISTHPYAGFGPWSNLKHAIALSKEDADFVPLSIFGKLENESDQEKIEIIRSLQSPKKIMNYLESLIH